MVRLETEHFRGFGGPARRVWSVAAHSELPSSGAVRRRPRKGDQAAGGLRCPAFEAMIPSTRFEVDETRISVSESTASPLTMASYIRSACRLQGYGLTHQAALRFAMELPQPLLLAVIFHMRLRSFVGVIPGVKRVASCSVCMMGRFFVLSALMMLGCFTMVTRGVRMVFR
jgi:hypothetical protein